MEKQFTDILDNYGFETKEGDIWVSVGSPRQDQGWKLHLTTVPSEAVKLMETVVPLLKKAGVAFKAIADIHLLELLNSGSMGFSQSGKFMTVYPDSDVQAVLLAKKLIRQSAGFRGPAIPSDLWLGSIVYTRFGAFHPIVVRNRLGEMEYFIRGADGKLQEDKRQIPFEAPDHITNPFEGLATGPKCTATQHKGNGKPKSEKLLGPGYLLVDPIRNAAKGAVFKAIDLRDQKSVGIKIIKQGRHDYLSDNYNRDIRTRLKRQQALHQLFNSAGVPTPQAAPYFESNGNGYLPIDYIEGENLEKVVNEVFKNRPWKAIPMAGRKRLLNYMGQACSVVAGIHRNGYVHRDITPSNLIVCKGKVWVIDFELAHRIGDSGPWFKLGTPGFMSPQQENHSPPRAADDIYSLGCVMLLMVTGLEPGRYLFAKNNNGRGLQRRLVKDGVHPVLAAQIRKCLARHPGRRPGIAEIAAAIKVAQGEVTYVTQKNGHGKEISKKSIHGFIEEGLKGVLYDTRLAKENGLWLSPQLQHDHSHLATGDGALEMRRGAGTGISGVVYLLARLKRLPMGSPEVGSLVKSAVDWLLSGHEAPDSGLPGLYFGDSGVAVSIAAAIKHGLVEKDDRTDRFFDRVIESKIDWPDVTHGAAGQGLAGYQCYDLTGDPKFLGLPSRCAEYLVRTQREDGSWGMPDGVAKITGKTFTGFAHGVSGMIYFLVEHHRRSGDSRSKAAYERGLDWLLGQMVQDKGKRFVSWPYSTDDTGADWKWWCHGGPGISLVFLRLFELTGKARYAEIADKALRIHPEDIRYLNLSQCHGLSGLGEIYLEAYRVLGDAAWKNRAGNIARVLGNSSRKADNGLVWAVQDMHSITADLMTGCSGILHFFLRFLFDGREMGFPLLPGPIAATAQAGGGNSI